MKIRIKEHGDLPIYQQIVNHIAGEILNGALPSGTKLPTIRVLAKKNGVSLGTVKHAYDTLLHMGLTEMTQGKGTFVCESEQVDSTSKKEQAMLALDTMIKQLRELPFTNQEIRIYFDLKMREYEEDDHHITVGIVDCSPEALSEINKQLSRFKNIEISEYLMSDLEVSPDLLRSDLHLFVTTANHYREVLRIIGREDNLMQMALGVSPKTVIALSQLQKEDSIGIVAASRAFGKVIRDGINTYAPEKRETALFILDEDKNLKDFLAAHEVIIGVPNIHKHAKSEEHAILSTYIQENSKYITFGYEVDEGSLLYIGNRIEAMVSVINT